MSTEFDPRVIIGSEMEMSGLVRNNRGDSVTCELCDNSFPSRYPIKSFHCNGSRTYIDLGHLEGCTPEVASAYQLTVYEAALEGFYRLVESRFRRDNILSGQRLEFFKINHDYEPPEEPGADSHTFGYHLNVFAKLDIAELVKPENLRKILPFLVTAQIFAGSGRLHHDGWFGISSRAESLTHVTDEWTTVGTRPIVNLRDESLADKNGYSRVHFSAAFDVNRAEYATYVKAGATALVLKLLELELRTGKKVLPDFRYNNDCALMDFKFISRSTADWRRSLKAVRKLWKLRGVPTGFSSDAIAIQRAYLQAAYDNFYDRLPERDFDRVMREWGTIINLLDINPEEAADRVDWIMKTRLLKAFAESESVSYQSAEIRAQELQYSQIAPRKTCWEGLQLTERLTQDAEVEAAQTTPPSGRASARGNFESWYRIHRARGGKLQREAEWNRVAIVSGRELLWEIKLADPFSSYATEMETARAIFEKNVP